MPSGVSYTVSLLLYSYSPSPRKASLLFTLFFTLTSFPRPARNLLSLLLYLYSHILPLAPKESFIFTLLSLLLIDA